jgi:hypothetical protein
MSKKKTTEEFVLDAKKVHGQKYDYSKVDYTGTRNKVKIICREHGSFTQLPLNHLKGAGCPNCAQLARAATQRYSTKEFIESVQKKHGLKYDYSEVDYVNSQTKVKIICKVHGSFLTKANSHSNGQGCPKCGRISARENNILDYPKFLVRAEKIHNNRYEYVESSYKKYTSKMKIYCSEHGFFEQTPHAHISMKSGCPQCGIINTALSNRKGWDNVLEMFNSVHGKEYEYDSESYSDVTHNMKIKCSKHGWFSQKPYTHYGGSGCNKCAVEKVHEKQKINFDEFVRRALSVHGSKYEYNSVNYTDIFTPTEIICAKHGEFSQNPRDHYRGAGCPKCLSSRGENAIRIILQGLGIEFEEQKTFSGLKHKYKLRCDFYLPVFNTVIEFNGLQHYQPVSVFGGLAGFMKNQKRDVIKYEYLNSAGIGLIIVRYDNENIHDYLKGKIKELRVL